MSDEPELLSEDEDSEIDTEYTNEIMCPYCGYVFSDSWEIGRGNDEDLGLIECGRCDREFYAARNVSISYSTEKAKYGKCPECGAENVILIDCHSSIGSHGDMCRKCDAAWEVIARKAYIEMIRAKNNDKV